MKFVALCVLLCSVIVKAEEALQPGSPVELQPASSVSPPKKQEKRGVYAGGYPASGAGYEQPLSYYGAAAVYNNPAYAAGAYSPGVVGGTYPGYTTGAAYNTAALGGYSGGIGYNPALAYTGGVGYSGYNPAYSGYSGYSGYPSNRVIGLGYSNGYNGYAGNGYNNGYYSRFGGSYPYTYNRYNTYSNYPASGYASVGAAGSGYSYGPGISGSVY